MKYCIIPDVHGRTFWKKAKEKIDDYDEVIFLGDYLDPYVEYDGINKEEAYENFIEILEFAKKYKHKVTLLVGNHDLHYFPDVSLDYGCRRDNKGYKSIQKLFVYNEELFDVTRIIDTKTYGKVLLTHAGVNKQYYNKYISKIINDGLNFFGISSLWLENSDNINKYLWRISYLRGGYDRCGSLVWSDLEEHTETSTEYVNKELGVDYQIFAHTYGFPSTEEIYQCKSYSMIDNKQIFEVE